LPAQADPGDDRIPLAVLCSRVIHQDADEAAAQLLAVRFDEKIIRNSTGPG
jgi:hypothetical protein